MPIQVDRKTFERLAGEKIPAKAKVRTRSEVGKKNKTEARFELEILRPRQQAGEILCWWYEAFKMRVGTDRCWLTIDFTIIRADGEIEQVDVKGGGPAEDDAMVKIKAAAAQYPQFHWSWWTLKKNLWTERKFGE